MIHSALSLPFQMEAGGEEHFDDFTDITFLHFCCTLLYIQFSGKKLNKKVEVFFIKQNEKKYNAIIVIPGNMK